MEALYKKANILYIPALALFALFVAYPFVDGIRIAFTNWNGFSRRFSYVGLRNFVRLFKDENVRASFWNTLLYGFGSTFFQQVLGLSLALFLDKKFPGRGITRTVVYLPVLISAVIMGYMWYYLLQYDGALNDIVALAGGEKRLWLSSAASAKSFILGVNTLQYCGISMVIYMAGLQNIAPMYYEAARIEGAGEWQVFRRVTVPLLYPAFVTSITINLIGGLKLFDIIKALTGGGPGYTTNSLATLIHSSYFASQMAGFAAANGLALFVLILAITLSLQAIFRKIEVQS
ncbi:MAG: sugar ABC transporter permease [Spirochaetes bacterium]|nr:sugar ABC transporter permease [Spirochaetota bacterium]MBU1079527.1 sugar ABC transporter permease [Spirochaetota bacterium]